MTINSRFSGTVPIFNDVSRKKPTDAHFSSLCLGVLDLCRFAHLCSRMPKNILYFICIYEKNLCRPETPLGELMTLPLTPKSDPRRLALLALAPYTIPAFGARRELRCPNYGHLIYILCSTNTHVTIIRVHRLQAVHRCGLLLQSTDAACSVVCLFVCLCVGHPGELCRNG